jgi:hypothetical protein
MQGQQQVRRDRQGLYKGYEKDSFARSAQCLADGRAEGGEVSGENRGINNAGV